MVLVSVSVEVEEYVSVTTDSLLKKSELVFVLQVKLYYFEMGLK